MLRICLYLCQMVAIMCLYLWGMRGLGSLKEDRKWVNRVRQGGHTEHLACNYCSSASLPPQTLLWAKTDMTLAEVPLSLAATRLPEIIKVLLKTGNVPIAPCHLTSMSFPNFHCPHFHLFTSLDLITCVLLACHCPVTCDHLPLPLVRLRAFLWSNTNLNHTYYGLFNR